MLVLPRLFRLISSRMQEAWKTSGLAMGPGIPAPTGQYRVGCVDLMRQLEGDDKGLLVKLHYPTAATPEQGYQYSLWYSHVRYIQGFFEFEGKEFTGDLTKFPKPQLPALERAPLLRRTAAGPTVAGSLFPVIVFSHGLGGVRTTNSSVLCDLASHGYVVASLEHRDGSAAVSLQRVAKSGGGEGRGGEGGGAGEFEDHWIKFYHLSEGEKEFPVRNKQVRQRADEVRKALDILTLLNEGSEIRNMMEGSFDFQQFKGRLDVSTAAVMGHSFGGGTTVQTLAEDKRFKCGIALDCWMVPIHNDLYKDRGRNISQPLYFINTYTFQWKINVERMLSLTKPPDAQGRTSCRVLTLRGTHHFNQCDVPFVAPRTLGRLGVKESHLDSVTAHKVNMDICHTFLKRHLLKDPAYQRPIPNLDGTEGHSEHIIFGTNVDLSDDNIRGFSGWEQSNL